MLDDFGGSSAESSTSANWSSERSNKHVYFVRVNVLCFGDTTTSCAEDAVGPGFVEDEAEFVTEFKFDL
jgi:hypothetical protein